MPRNRTSDDIDHVIPDPKPSNAAKTRPPEPWPLPNYEPMHIKQPFRRGVQLVHLTTDAKPCRACIAAGRKVGRHIGKAASKRKILGELAPNSVLQGRLPGRRKERPPRSRFGCNICQISLCNHKTCWKDHIGLVE